MSQQPFYDREVPLSRVYVDDDGVEWEVLEVDGRQVPAARGEACLVFRSPQAMRRVWNYPRAWATLSARELCRLSWQR